MILPVALAFKIFGVGLIQGRVVASIYALLTLITFFCAGKALAGQRAAIISIFVLLNSPGDLSLAGFQFLIDARQVQGLCQLLAFSWLAFLFG